MGKGKWTNYVIIMAFAFNLILQSSCFQILEDQNERMDRKLKDLSKTVAEMSTILKAQTEDIYSINSTVEGMRTRQSYSFTVRLGSKSTVGNGRKLNFQEIWQNTDKSFDEEKSVFVCKESGLYYFHSMICCQVAKTARFHIVRNRGQVLGFIYTQDAANNDCAGNGVTSELQVGDTVWLRSRFTSYVDPNTFFTGFKVQ